MRSMFMRRGLNESLNIEHRALSIEHFILHCSLFNYTVHYFEIEAFFYDFITYNQNTQSGKIIIAR